RSRRHSHARSTTRSCRRGGHRLSAGQLQRDDGFSRARVTIGPYGGADHRCRLVLITGFTGTLAGGGIGAAVLELLNRPRRDPYRKRHEGGDGSYEDPEEEPRVPARQDRDTNTDPDAS